jgi:hypothetical protein
MSRMVVSYHVGELEKMDLVFKKRDGRANRLFIRSIQKETDTGIEVPEGPVGIGAEI